MSAQTNITDRRPREVFWAIKAPRGGLTCMGGKPFITRLKLVSASWKMSFKFVINTVANLLVRAKTALGYLGFEGKKYCLISIRKSPFPTALDTLVFALFHYLRTSTPKHIVVNPMITESA